MSQPTHPHHLYGHWIFPGLASSPSRICTADGHACRQPYMGPMGQPSEVELTAVMEKKERLRRLREMLEWMRNENVEKGMREGGESVFIREETTNDGDGNGVKVATEKNERPMGLREMLELMRGVNEENEKRKNGESMFAGEETTNGRDGGSEEVVLEEQRPFDKKRQVTEDEERLEKERRRLKMEQEIVKRWAS